MDLNANMREVEHELAGRQMDHRRKQAEVERLKRELAQAEKEEKEAEEARKKSEKHLQDLGRQIKSELHDQGKSLD